MALLGLIVTDPEFYHLTKEGHHVSVDVSLRLLKVREDSSKDIFTSFPFTLSKMEEKLISEGGVTEMYKNYGSALFRVAMKNSGGKNSASKESCGDSGAQLVW